MLTSLCLHFIILIGRNAFYIPIAMLTKSPTHLHPCAHNDLVSMRLT